MKRYLPAFLLTFALAAPVAVTPLRADDHRRVYKDDDRHDEHHWDAREDKAYRIWAKENHRKRVNFEKMREEDQRNYWKWRHDHSDALLKIDIR